MALKVNDVGRLRYAEVVSLLRNDTIRERIVGDKLAGRVLRHCRANKKSSDNACTLELNAFDRRHRRYGIQRKRRQLVNIC